MQQQKGLKPQGHTFLAITDYIPGLGVGVLLSLTSLSFTS
jgi:hypothetical protein